MPQASLKVYPQFTNSAAASPVRDDQLRDFATGPVGDLQRRLASELTFQTALNGQAGAGNRFETMIATTSRLIGPALLVAGYGAVAWFLA